MSETPDSPKVSDSAVPDWLAELAEAVAEIGKAKMPFGKFGPKDYPPAGVPLYDLPVEYLLWFRQKGFPKGKLGKLLELTCQIKVDGAESVFEPFRRRAGGRVSLRQKRQKQWDFGD